MPEAAGVSDSLNALARMQGAVAESGLLVESLLNTVEVGARISESAVVSEQAPAAIPTYNTSVREAASGAEVLGAGFVFSLDVNEVGVATDEVRRTLTASPQVVETADVEDVTGVLVNFATRLNEAAQATTLVRAQATFFSQTLDTAEAEDAPSRRLYWEPVDDMQDPDWQNVADTQVASWQQVVT